MECKYVIDRIEGGYAVCECDNGEMISIPLQEIGIEVKEGQTLIKNKDVYSVKQTENARARSLFDKLFKKGR
ncbi:MAG: DUF3006 domain-containing protein [Clostridia bacterium]|nr:DUF3006 domain-containing protein [Clostridia bacterium]